MKNTETAEGGVTLTEKVHIAKNKSVVVSR